MNTLSFKKVHPALAFFLTNITLGVYVPYWFMSRKDSIEQLGQTHVKFKTIKLLFVLYMLMFAYYFVGKAFFTELGANFVETIHLWITFTGLGITYYSVFRISEVMEREFEEIEFNKFLILLFHIWYLQYKINQLLPKNK